MIFKKKKKSPRMVDVRELQKRGVVKIPKSKPEIPSTKEGFVELGSLSGQKKESKPVSNTDFFGFTNTVAPKPETTNHQLPTTNSPGGYNKREVDAKITNLDNKIYKLEQRLELLEKKLDVNQKPANLGAMGW